MKHPEWINEKVGSAYTRILQTGMLGPRQLVSLGISTRQVYENTGLTIYDAQDKFKHMDLEQRAIFLDQMIDTNPNSIKEIKKIINDTINSFTPKKAFLIGIFFGAWLITSFLYIATM